MILKKGFHVVEDFARLGMIDDDVEISTFGASIESGMVNSLTIKGSGILSLDDIIIRGGLTIIGEFQEIHLSNLTLLNCAIDLSRASGGFLEIWDCFVKCEEAGIIIGPFMPTESVWEKTKLTDVKVLDAKENGIVLRGAGDVVIERVVSLSSFERPKNNDKDFFISSHCNVSMAYITYRTIYCSSYSKLNINR